jgi:hypothetical protein
MRLVSNWQTAWKWFSVQAIAAATLWESLPVEAKEAVPEPWRGYVTLGLLVVAGIGRMIDQRKGA